MLGPGFDKGVFSVRDGGSRLRSHPRLNCPDDQRAPAGRRESMCEIEFLPVGDGERSGDALALRFV